MRPVIRKVRRTGPRPVVNFRTSPLQFRRLVAYAKQHGVTITGVLEFALQRFLDKERV